MNEQTGRPCEVTLIPAKRNTRLQQAEVKWNWAAMISNQKHRLIRRISVLRHFAQQHKSMEPISLVLAVQVTDGAIMRKSFLGNSWAPIHSPLNATAYLSVVGYVLSFLAIIDSLLMATTRVIRIEVIWNVSHETTIDFRSPDRNVVEHHWDVDNGTLLWVPHKSSW